MDNRIGNLIESHSKNLSEFSRLSGVSYGTLYDIVKGTTKVGNISISNFLKISACLGMTAEELYYGTPPKTPTFSDPRQVALNGHYESLNDESKTALTDFAKSYASDPERRIGKKREDAGHRTALGA